MELKKDCFVFSVLVLLIVVQVSTVSCGECCTSYKDLLGTEHSSEWCSDYCCYDKNTLGFTLSCCDNEILRAPEEYRDSVCFDWLSSHAYVPVIGIAVIVAAIVALCCCCGCCRRRRDGVIIQSSVQAGAPMIIHQPQQQQQVMTDPYHAGYNQ